MEPSRRRLLAGVAAGLGGAVSGCLGVLSGDEAAGFAAAPARVTPAVLAESGYAPYRIRQDTISRPVGAYGLTRRVEVANWIAEYDRAVDLGGLGLGRLQAAVFAALATPQVDLLGLTFNPVGGMSTDELAELIQEHYGAITDIQHETSTTATVLGNQTTLARYRAAARLLAAGLEVDVYLYLTAAVRSADDYVVCVAAHPRVAGQRTATVRSLLDGVRHPVAPP